MMFITDITQWIYLTSGNIWQALHTHISASHRISTPNNSVAAVAIRE